MKCWFLEIRKIYVYFPKHLQFIGGVAEYYVLICFDIWTIQLQIY